jgi:AICAR transformylase/IMP cyclohydrolase PurH
MSAYDDWRCTDSTADQAAAEALHAELVRQQVVIAPQELGEHLAALTNEQFDQILLLVLEATDERLQYAIRELVCGKLVDKRVKEMVK